MKKLLIIIAAIVVIVVTLSLCDGYRHDYKKDIGKTFEVLVEGVSKRSRDQLFGRTQQYKVVVFDRANHKVGDFVNVRITEATSATLKGVLVE